ncbi:WD40/YVTN/BNR-like repeat-containing protein [Longitalea arenae]|uniref:WD40/YVTN/BNR-like repeat-containing protein n=1 Tax=Longitalea arenae TaxID=2812558 RepID=UPI001967D8B7|nr:hypothetical protein [Longitalea arenae]
MELPAAPRHLVVVVLIILSVCFGQTGKNTKSLLYNDFRLINYSSGVVYFSYDNGLTWHDKSSGLPSTVNIGLGGIAVSGNKLALISKDSGLYFFNTQEDKWLNIGTDKQLIENNMGALLFFKDHIYVGTQLGGIFRTKDEGKSWTKLNIGLDNLTIRKLAEIKNRLYAATNSGLYSYNDLLNQWELEYGNTALQVNGITTFDGSIYIATNQGAFASPIGKKEWRKILLNGALHNISSDNKAIYAMVYNELFSSFDKGQTWHSMQAGLPAQLYTFDVIKTGNTLLAAQWDGVYRRNTEAQNWEISSNGLPENIAVTNIQMYSNIIVISGNERKLRKGMTADK